MMVGTWISPEHPLLAQARQAGIDVVYPEVRKPCDEAQMVALMRDAHGTIAGTEPYTERVLAGSPLRVISRPGVGYDAVDVRAATARGIAVCTTPGTNSEAVADHAFALLLAVARQIVPSDRHLRSEEWRLLRTADVFEQTLGILGLGQIGKGVARRARGFGMRVVAFDPYWDAAFAAQHQVERRSLEEVIREADFLTLHLPSNAATRHTINAERLALMKPTAYLINAARGALVDEVALHAALSAGSIAGAGLDVFEREPLGASPLLALPNVVLTPHSAFHSPRADAATIQMSLENALRVLQGQRPQHCVNPEVFGGPGR